jgi:hypothetical protein
MPCPVCKSGEMPSDCSCMEVSGERVMVQGRVYAIIDEDKRGKAYYPPFADYLTVSLRPRKGRVKYLKFKTQEELRRWSFVEGKSFIAHGCLHIADSKELLFDISQVEPVV